MPSRSPCACIRIQWVDLYFYYSLEPKPKNIVIKFKVEQGTSVVCCTFQATFRGTLQANFVNAAMQNRGFKYQNL